MHYSEGAGAGAGAAGAFLCTTNRGKLLQHKLIRVQCTKTVPEYRYPLYRNTGTRFKKLFLSIVLPYSRKVIFETYNPYIWVLFAPFQREEFLFAPFHRGTEITNSNKKTDSLHTYLFADHARSSSIVTTQVRDPSLSRSTAVQL